MIPTYPGLYQVISGTGLKTLKLSEDNQAILDSLIRQVEFYHGEVDEINSRIASDAINNRHVNIIMSMTGFDYNGASVLAAYIVDIARFPSPGRLVSWIGMCPSVYQSSETMYLGKMKDGNSKANWILTQAAKRRSHA